MRKLVQPKCSVCNSASLSLYESELWPTLRLCYQCAYRLSSWCIKTIPDLLDNNPLTEELLGGIWDTFGGVPPNDSHYSIWHRSNLSNSNASSQRLIRRVDKKFE